VTKGWLEGLIRCAKSDKKIGVVGCSSNPGTNEPLFFTGCPMYRSKEDIQRTAVAVSMIRKGVYIDVDLVHGLCMFIKRELINKIGLFDERFYPCGREDIDYVVRARKAGYRTVDAMDVFVFHFYNKSTTSKAFTENYGHIDEVTETAIDRLRIKMGKSPLAVSRTR
jgi:GT2 family glycosyltransferase